LRAFELGVLDQHVVIAVRDLGEGGVAASQSSKLLVEASQVLRLDSFREVE
jgi:hypothetical protein